MTRLGAELVAGVAVAGIALAFAAHPTRTSAEPATAHAAAGVTEQVSVAEHLDRPIDPTLAFVDERSREVTLGQYFGAERPLLITLNYFRCETLCDLQLQRLTRALRAIDDVPSSAFRIVTVSIDPTDTPDAAAHRRSGYLAQAGRADLAWRFLVGAEKPIRALAGQLGFRYAYDERSDQYAHAPVLFLVSPQGRIVRYLYGIDYPPADLRLAIVDASQGRVGSTADKLLLRCFRFDPATGRYGVYVLGFIRTGGALIVCALVLGFIALRRAEARRQG